MRIALPRMLFAFLLAAAAVPAAARAESVTIGFAPVPPYVVEKPDGSVSGLEHDLVAGAMKLAGLSFVPRIVPFGRLPEDFRRGVLPAYARANAAVGLNGCLSDTLLVFRNIAMSLAEKNLPIDNVGDLVRYSVLAFQNAHRVLGPEMAIVSAGNLRYQEVANQTLQIRGLFSGRAEVIVGERRILLALMRAPDIGVDTAKPVREHLLFQPTDYGVAFRDDRHCRAFNGGLAKLRSSGEYDRILRRYDPAPNGGAIRTNAQSPKKRPAPG